MNNPSSDQQLVNFLKQHRPNCPEAAPDLELKLLATIERNEQTENQQIYRKKIRSIVSKNRSIVPGFSQWCFPGAIAGMLILFGSGYRLLVPAQFNPDEGAHLEAFLVNNWEDVLHDSRADNMSDSSQIDWFNFQIPADSEQPTNN
ncbi:hypothetical protein [Microcoleus sp. CAWBG640]|uniref:hypothetical protein n=1 Tax=Microcoleus sp. CAWBG640 TaxID=2841653 RepID=UPI00312B79F7